MKDTSDYLISSYYSSRTSLKHRLMSQMDGSADDDAWLVSFSDVLSLLLVFFVMFLVITKGRDHSPKALPAEYPGTTIPTAKAALPGLRGGSTIGDEVTTEMNRLDLGDELSVRATEKEVTVTIREKVTFMPGEAEILPGFAPVLDNLARTIKRHPSLEVDIIGHTDNVPINTVRYPSNWELSVARAASVLRYLIHIHSLDPSRLSIKGNADQKPLAPNNSPANRARNRRVEIRLVNSAKAL